MIHQKADAAPDQGGVGFLALGMRSILPAQYLITKSKCLFFAPSIEDGKPTKTGIAYFLS